LHKNIKSKPSLNSFFSFSLSNSSDTFSFELKDKNNITFYTFSNDTFLYTDRFINFESILTTNDIYGFGERGHELKLNDGIYTIWPNDTGGIQMDEGNGGKNGYSHQPVGLHRTKIENIWLGFIFLNSNNQDVVIKTLNEYGTTSLQHKTIGGIIDYYIIIAKSPIEVVQNIHKILGYPFLPPYWAVAYHQSRLSYNHISNFKTAYNNFKKYEIPVDTMWVDIDTYDNYQIFSVDNKTWDGLGDFVKKFQTEDHTHFIPIIDIGVGNGTGDKFAALGKKLNCFIKSNYTKTDLFLEVWPGATLFPDYLNPNTTFFWEYGLNSYQNLVHFDGIWFDMNEIAGLKRDLPCIGELADKCDKKDNYYYYDDLPYLPGFNYDNSRTNMAAGTINENGLLYGPDERKYAIYNTKPILSYTQNKISFNYLKSKLKKRPFIISRSATFGTGKYNGHWLGDNGSHNGSMRNSLDGIFQFVIYGIPMTGDDICGFFGDSYGTLCNRWYNLGVFYPFSRNHNTGIDQFPWSFNDTNILNNIKNAINFRYMILRYIYSYLFSVSLNEKVGFFNPVFFSYPNELNSYNNINDKVMIGDAFILFPIFSDDTQNISRIFPSGKWYYFPNGKMLLNKNDDRNVTLSGEFDVIHLYMKDGVIVPWQNTFDKYIKNSYYLRSEKLNLIINPDEEKRAKGVIFFDNDGIDTIENEEYIRVDLNYDNGILTVNNTMKEEFKYEYNDNILGMIELFGTDNNEESNITIILKNSSVYNYFMSKDFENDKFYIKLNESLIINEINKIEFTFA
jgi:alpha-glucosidase (family GH31 glycosyl hydrolase)